jgi:hypothetical protein
MVQRQVWALAWCVGVVGAANAQLLPPEVLVVYDSRNADSRAVAEYYAGSHVVPGGQGGLPGARRGVKVFDLAGSGAAQTNPGTISYAHFIERLRNPLRAHLEARNLTQTIRCIVLTKGLPHRVQDTNNPNIGDSPSGQANEFGAGDATSCSVDSELSLLWIDLDQQTVQGSRLNNGCIINPYWRAPRPIGLFSTRNIRRPKSFVVATGLGQIWQTDASAAVENRLTQGDIYLVCRLDAHSVADVRAMIDRARNLRVDVDNVAFILDESNSNGITDALPNSELDNTDPQATRFGDDFEQTRDRLTITDRRFNPANVFYNKDAGANEFFVGPRLAWQGSVRLVSMPVILLATYGSNHSGLPLTTTGVSAGGVYADSFHYAPGAIFNTVESYNGRDFGGQGGWTGGGGVPQEQAADFIAAGGTFAVANVWEPFTLSLPDNAIIVRNFLLSDVSWGEAAYAALPVLSWQQIVLGDPLARVVRSCEDIDGDGAVTVDDVHAWYANPRDINRDGVANAADVQIIWNTIRFHEQLQMIRGRE